MPVRALPQVLRLAGLGLVCALLVGISHSLSHERIIHNRELHEQQRLLAVLGDEDYQLTEIRRDLYSLRLHGEAAGFLFQAVTREGYNGEIRLWVGVDDRGRVLGVRVIQHQETPGLGDRIDLEVSDWITGFRGLSLEHPIPARWKVRKDGGHFDQFTGATITPRAVVAAVALALQRMQDSEFPGEQARGS